MISFKKNEHVIHWLMQNIKGDQPKTVPPLWTPETQSAYYVTPIVGGTRH